MTIDAPIDFEEIKKVFEDKKIRNHVYFGLQNLFQRSNAILIINLFEDLIKTGKNNWHNPSHFSFSNHSLSKNAYYEIIPKLVRIGVLDANTSSSESWNSTRYIRLNEDFILNILIPLVLFIANKRKINNR
ncbi:MAG: hypothetical protein ACXAES_08595 [Promethearchaeota archaeon]|jgi:hypothetical protein